MERLFDSLNALVAVKYEKLLAKQAWKVEAKNAKCFNVIHTY